VIRVLGIGNSTFDYPEEHLCSPVWLKAKNIQSFICQLATHQVRQWAHLAGTNPGIPMRGLKRHADDSLSCLY
tara:strand:- start:377 stop:595 length:219 start_codon:yes stop_codon:yes gene_type:complete